MNAIILCGGRSRRMNGTRKAFLRLDGKTFLERIIEVLTPLVESCLIVTNEPDLYAGLGAGVVRDAREGMGPLMGISSGLKASGSQTSFVTAVDTPLLSVELVRYLIRARGECDVLAPRWDARVQPLCAVYARRCLAAMEEVLSAKGGGEETGPPGRIRSLFPMVRLCVVEEPLVRGLDPNGLSFLNVNTRADYRRLRERFRRLPPGA